MSVINSVQTLLEQGFQHHRQGELQAAEACYWDALQQDPVSPEANHMLGVLALQCGKWQVAFDFIQKAIYLDPNMPTYHTNLALVFDAAGRHTEAIASLQQALRLKPDDPTAHFNLGNMYVRLGRLSEAREGFQAATRANPDYVEAWYNLGVCLQAMGEDESACDCYRKTLAIMPHAHAYHNLGSLYHQQGRLEDAAACFKGALRLNASDPDFYNNLGAVLYDLKNFDHARQAFEAALKRDPNNLSAGNNLALIKILMGEQAEGWRDLARYRQPSAVEWRTFNRPPWDGGDLNGKRILLVPHSGFGDTIQCLRFLPLLKAQGATVLFETQPEMARLLAAHPAIDRLVLRHSEEAQTLAYDTWAYLICLPGLLNMTPEDLPPAIGSLLVPAEAAAAWQARLEGNAAFKIGVVWAGEPKHSKVFTRHIPVKDFDVLPHGKQIMYYSLQKGAFETEARDFPKKLPFVDLAPDIADFWDLAGIISHLDLVISVDTSVAHLAGVLGKPVCTLVPDVPDYRWGLTSEETPWYPTMRLVRQTRPNDWRDPLKRINRLLAPKLL